MYLPYLLYSTNQYIFIAQVRLVFLFFLWNQAEKDTQKLSIPKILIYMYVLYVVTRAASLYHLTLIYGKYFYTDLLHNLFMNLFN